MFLAVPGRVIVEILKKEEKKTVILMTKEEEERYVNGRVVSSGCKRFKSEETVLIDRYSGHRVKIDDRDFIIMKGDDILASILTELPGPSETDKKKKKE